MTGVNRRWVWTPIGVPNLLIYRETGGSFYDADSHRVRQDLEHERDRTRIERGHRVPDARRGETVVLVADQEQNRRGHRNRCLTATLRVG